MKFRVEEILNATGGCLLAGRGDADAGVVCTDSRRVQAGQTFLALRGERFDAHDFLPDAVRLGAACLVIDRDETLPAHLKSKGACSCGCSKQGPSPAVTLVADTQAALADLGRAARARLACPVIAVTGSCGKTTTKEMIGQILLGRLRGRKPPASYNNSVGVPLTLLACEPDDEFVLCECGTNHPGEIAALAAIARPTVAVVTLAAPVHLEGLGSIDGVAAEKGALVESLGPDGVAILNADDPRVAAMAGRCRGRAVTVGTGEGADLRASDIVQTERSLTFMAAAAGGPPVRFEIPVMGRHNAVLALAAAAAAREAGVSLEDSAAALRAFQAAPMRMAVRQLGRITLVNDAFNANPRSTQAALELLELWPARRKVFFFGDMLELGDTSAAAHEEIGRAIAAAGIQRLICVGPQSQLTAAAAVAAGLDPAEVTVLDDSVAAAAMAPGLIADGDVVLVKGSHGIRMDRVAVAIASVNKHS